ncbi:MAG: hypothetical protein KatS3mg035_1336 [Bacteroidia bacterium]|nr:MAG: hypothetical protein KatS3mg035_1336 [Bacteroidia bacterium]
MKNLLAVLLCFVGFNMYGQSMMVYNPNDSKCVIKAYSQSVSGSIATVKITVDNQKRYYYEYNWKTKTGYKGTRVTWEKDVMEIACEACKKGIPLESIGFKPY